MPPSSALGKMALALSDNYRSIKADLYNIEETTKGPRRSKRLVKLDSEYRTNTFSSLPNHIA